MNVALAWSDALLRASVQAGGLAIVAWTLFRLVPATSPNVRSWAWRLVALKFALTIFAPVPVVAPAPYLPRTNEAELPLAAGIGVLSLCGIVSVIWSTLRDLQTVRRARSCSMPVDRWVLDEARRVARIMGVPRTPRVRRTEAIAVPALVGVWRPMILLPETFLSRCEADELRMVLAHELAHLRRHDLAWGWLGIVLRSLFFFHPLAWLALREAQAADEAACDALVIERLGASRRKYGLLLLRLASADLSVPHLAAAVSAGAASVRRRIDALVQPSRPRVGASAACLILTLVALPGYRSVSPPISPVRSLPDARNVYPPAAPAAAPSLGRWAPARETLLVERKS